MKKVMYLVVVATAIVFTSCGGEATTDEHNHEGHDHTEISSTKYACPMKCEGEKTYSEKGECPKCHMDLEEVE